MSVTSVTGTQKAATAQQATGREPEVQGPSQGTARQQEQMSQQPPVRAEQAAKRKPRGPRNRSTGLKRGRNQFRLELAAASQLSGEGGAVAGE